MSALLYAVPRPHSQPLSTQASTGNFWTFTVKSDSVSFGIAAPFSWVLVCKRFCFCLPRVCFGGSMVALMATSSKRTYATSRLPRSAVARTHVPTVCHCWLIPLQNTLRPSKAGLTQSLLGSLGPGLDKVLFEPCKSLWWAWSLILSVILFLLLSC